MEKKQKTFDDIKKEIRSLLISSPVGLRLQDLLSDYRSMIGVHLPFQEFGYSSALDLIKHIPDVVYPVFRAGGVMHLEAVPDSTTIHIKKLVLQQKKSGKISRIRKAPDESLARPPPKRVVPALIRMKLKELLRSYPEGLEESKLFAAYTKRFGVDLNVAKFGFPSLKKLLQECSEMVSLVNNNVNGKNMVVLFLKEKSNGVSADIKRNQGSQNVSGGRTQQITFSKNSMGTSSSVKSPTRKSESQSSENSVSKKSSKRVPSLMELEPEVNKKRSIHNQGDQKKQFGISAESGVSDHLKSEIKDMLQGKQNGMWLARLPFEYKRLYKKELDMKAAGYFSLIALVGSIPDVVRIDRPVKNGDWLLTPAIQMNELAFEDPLPKDAVKYDGNYQKLVHPTEGQMEIFIVQINDPSSFFLHWYSKKASLDKLMGEMSDFYKSVSSQSYLLPPSHRKTGQVCCAIYEDDGEWYRAIIIKVLPEGDQIEVLFIDYGDRAIVHPNDLRLLKKPFIELPAMCIKGSLANIKPVHANNWMPESSSRFFDLTKDKVLLGRIHKYENDVVSLELADTNCERKVHINDILVIERLASYENILANQRQPFVQSRGYSNPNLTNQQMQPMSPVFQNAPFGNFAMNLEALKQQAALMNPMQFSTMLPFLYTSMLQNQQMQHVQANPACRGQNGQVPPTIGSAAQPFRHAASDSQLTHGYDHAAKNITVSQTTVSEEFNLGKKSSSIDSLIECINSELDGKYSSEEANVDEESCGESRKFGSANNDVFSDEITEEESEICEESVEEEEREPREANEVKILRVPQPYKLCVVNYEDRPYVTRGEIAALLWHKDILRQMLRQQKVAVPSIVISRDENQELFENLANENIKDMEDGFKEFLTLYELESLPKILDVFKHKSEELKTIVKEEINQYRNCPDKYWGNSEASEIEEDIEEDSLALELELEEMCLLLQSMQFRRKRLVNSLMSKAPSPDTVDELKRVEEEVEKIRKQVQLKEGNFD